MAVDVKSLVAPDPESCKCSVCPADCVVLTRRRRRAASGRLGTTYVSIIVTAYSSFFSPEPTTDVSAGSHS